MKRKKAKILTFYYNNYRIDIEIRCEINFCLHVFNIVRFASK